MCPGSLSHGTDTANPSDVRCQFKGGIDLPQVLIINYPPRAAAKFFNLQILTFHHQRRSYAACSYTSLGVLIPALFWSIACSHLHSKPTQYEMSLILQRSLGTGVECEVRKASRAQGCLEGKPDRRYTPPPVLKSPHSKWLTDLDKARLL